jgi:xylulokinase
MSPGRAIVLGADLGSTALKVGAFDDQGNLLALARQTYPIRHPEVAWSEQRPEEWLEAFGCALAELATEVRLGDVRAISAVGQSPTLVAVDAQGAPVRPAIGWADRRAAREIVDVARRLGLPAAAMEYALLPRVVWLQRHEPEHVAATRWFLQAIDFLPFALTGTASATEAIRGRPPWNTQQVEVLGIDPGRLPQRTVTPGSVIDTMRDEAAQCYGLPPGVKVVAGTIDSFGHWIGVDLTRPGSVCNVAGTSEGVSMAVEAVPDGASGTFFATPNPLGANWVLGGSMSSGGNVLDWLVNGLQGGSSNHDALLAAAAEVGPGAGDLIALPYLRGERTPIYDATARGCLIGLRPDHTIAHVTRAMLEAIAFGQRLILDELRSLGTKPIEVVVTGRGSRSYAFNTIKADVLQLVVRPAAVADAGVVGAAMLATAAITGEALPDVARRLAHFDAPVEPNPATEVAYDRTYGLQREAYAALRDTFRDLAIGVGRWDT